LRILGLRPRRLRVEGVQVGLRSGLVRRVRLTCGSCCLPSSASATPWPTPTAAACCTATSSPRTLRWTESTVTTKSNFALFSPRAKGRSALDGHIEAIVKAKFREDEDGDESDDDEYTEAQRVFSNERGAERILLLRITRALAFGPIVRRM
jgi:hypothetical protein